MSVSSALFLISNAIVPRKEPFGEMADSNTEAGSTRDESGSSFRAGN